MLCPICAEEFMERVSDCPGCGCSLVPSSIFEHYSEEASPRTDEEIEFVELCRPQIYPVAMLIKEMLEQNGIPVFIKGGHSLSVMPHLAFGGELRVLVASNRLEYARALYRAYFESDEDTDFIPEED